MVIVVGSGGGYFCPLSIKKKRFADRMFPVAPQTTVEMMKEGTVGRLTDFYSTLLVFSLFFFKVISRFAARKREGRSFFCYPAVPAVFFTPPPPVRGGVRRAPGRPPPLGGYDHRVEEKI